MLINSQVAVCLSLNNGVGEEKGPEREIGTPSANSTIYLLTCFI